MKYVMSDIHGNLDAFRDIMAQIDLKDDDELFILGDIVDRKSAGIYILQQIMEMPNVHMLLGNHEYMMMAALGFPYEDTTPYWEYDIDQEISQWYQNGGEVTHHTWNELSTAEQEKIKEFLKTLPLSITTEVNGETFQLIHASLEEIYDQIKGIVQEPKACFCVWDRDSINFLEKFTDCKVVFGHTTTRNLQPCNPMTMYNKGNIYGIDCGAAYGPVMGGRLCCLRLDDMHVFYSK